MTVQAATQTAPKPSTKTRSTVSVRSVSPLKGSKAVSTTGPSSGLTTKKRVSVKNPNSTVKIVDASAKLAKAGSQPKKVSDSKKLVRTKGTTKKGPGAVSTWPGDGNDDNTIRVRKAGEVVAERFRRQIANGTLAIGHQLPSEEELTTMFGIARTTLREALRVLESQGLLEIKRGRGGGGIITMPRLDTLSQSLALVLQLQHTTLGDLDDARMMIEPPLAGRLASQHSDEDLEVLTAIVDRAHECAETDDKNGFGKAAAMLHEAIIERGGNNTMAVVGALLHDLVDRHLQSAAEISDHEQMSRAVRSYRKLIQLIESGDSVAATAHWHRQLVFLQQHRASIQLLDIFND